jgi:hypothetical protein
MPTPIIHCPHPLGDGRQGLETIEVGPTQRQLLVSFFVAPEPGSFLFDTASYTISGGRRLHPRITAVTGSGPQLTLHLDQPGDFSIYTLAVQGPGIDPFFASRRFSFKIDCDDPFDCRPATSPLPPEPDAPVIDYLTKDYAGFRQLLLEQLPARLPEWTERSEADVGIALVELLAEAADRLSYYQDRVANEAFLETATQRRSVELHVALTGYRLRPGAAASTFLRFDVARDTVIPAGTAVQTHGTAAEPPVVFETGPGDALLRPQLNALTPYTWGNAPCCLPAGATELALVEDASSLRAGDAVAIEDTPDPDRTQIVVLAEDAIVRPADVSTGEPRLTVLRWAASQALQHEHCLDGRTVVRGNVVPATHGASEGREQRVILGAGDESLKRLRFKLPRAPLTFLRAPGRAAYEATSTLRITVDDEPWSERVTLVDSGPFDRHYRVELDDEGYATVVFGDGIRGQQPATGATVAATYRIGIGTAGNVGRDTLIELVARDDNVQSVTNPCPATGGLPPESQDEARRVAPLRVQVPIRAVTEADYERAAREYMEDGSARVERAKARFLWTGSWHTVFISIDPVGGQSLSAALRARLSAYLKTRKLAGYDLEIVAAIYVPLLIGLRVCVRPEFFAGDVRTRLLYALSNAANADGSRGFFHPDRFTFGEPVLLSRLYAAVEAVSGVDSVVITDFRRLHHRDPQQATTQNIAAGYVEIGEFEIARLDNDPSFPENGRLALDVLGGR